MKIGHIVYRTENLVNGKFYIGVHNGNNPDYLGSGVALRRAIKKYGLQSFKRTTLTDNLTESEAYELEELIVDEDTINDKNCYNCHVGGKGGFTDEERIKAKEGSKKLRGIKQGPLSEEHKDKISKSNIGRKAWNEGMKGVNGKANARAVINTITGERFESLSAAGASVGILKSAICNRISRGDKTFAYEKN